MKTPFFPFPILKTERLSLNEVTLSNIEDTLHLRSDSEINKYTYRANPTKTIQDATEFVEKIINETKTGESVNWSITQKGKSEMIGSLCLWNFSKDRKRAEIGYSLKTGFHNQGLMTEAIEKILYYGFKTLNLELIEAYTSKRNKASLQLLKKCNFILNPERKDSDNPDNVILTASSTIIEVSRF